MKFCLQKKRQAVKVMQSIELLALNRNPLSPLKVVTARDSFIVVLLRAQTEMQSNRKEVQKFELNKARKGFQKKAVYNCGIKWYKPQQKVTCLPRNRLAVTYFSRRDSKSIIFLEMEGGEEKSFLSLGKDLKVAGRARQF